MATAYADVAEVRDSLGLEQSRAAPTLERLIEVASERVNYVCDRSFGPPVNDVRMFAVAPAAEDDVSEVVLDDLQLDPSPTLAVADSEFADEWNDLDRDHYRFDGDGANQPVTFARIKGRPKWLRVTGQFGWREVPAQITRATVLLAARLWQREQSPLGTIAAGGELGDLPVQRYDPDFLALIQSFRRRSVG